MKKQIVLRLSLVVVVLAIIVASVIRYNENSVAVDQEGNVEVPAIVSRYFDGTQDNPEDRMKKDGSAQLGTEQNPFVVVEVVPKLSLAEVGYLIQGCEPVSMGALLHDPLYTTYLSRLGSVAEREETYTEETDDKWPEQLEAGARINDSSHYWPANVANPGVQFVDDTNGVWTRKSIWNDLEAKSGYYEKAGEGNQGGFAVKYELRQQAKGNYILLNWGNNITGEPEWDGYSTPDAIWRWGGYYQKVEEGTGDYILAPIGIEPRISGAYRWVDAENTENIATDYGADKIWSVRKGDYYHYYKKTTYAEWKHSDAMIKSIFGDEVAADEIYKEVITITPYDLRNLNNQSLLTYADMIYIHGGHSQGNATNSLEEIWTKFNIAGEGGTKRELSQEENDRDTFEKNDIPWSAAIEIVERMASDNPAALVMDAQVNVGDQAKNDNNCRKLCLMLRQYGPVLFKKTFLDTGKVFEGGEDRLNACGLTTGVYENETLWDVNTLLPKNMSREQMNEQYGITNPDFSAHWDAVADNTYIYSGDKSMLEDYTSASVWENEYNKEAFDYYYEITGTRPDKIKTNEVVRYLLQEDVVKKKVKILEVEPCNKFIYNNDNWQNYYPGTKYDYTTWEEYYALILPWLSGDWDKNLEVDTMTTAQFNASITDLNSEYDAIIFGMEQDVSNGAQGYNDERLSTFSGTEQNRQRVASLVYTSVGDKVATKKNRVRGVDSDDTLRFSGNDITEKKYQELLSYMAGGKPIILDKAFLDNNKNVNRQWVDASSKMYQLALQTNLVDGGQANLFVRDCFKAATLRKLLAYNRCKLRFVRISDTNPGYPTEYSYETEQTKITKTKYGPVKKNDKWYMESKSVDKNYTLNGAIKKGSVTYASRTFMYIFKIQGSVNDTYGIDLYVDVNGDGVYTGSLKEPLSEQNEKVMGVVVRDRYTNQIVDSQQLQANREYILTKQLESNYAGILPWKLEAHMTTGTGNGNCRSSEIKYSAIEIQNSSDKTKIRVLLMNVTPNMTDPADFFSADYDYAAKSVIRMDKMEEFTEYLNRVEEFDFELNYLPNHEWKERFGTSLEAWKQELDTYDMIILGFNDDATYTNDEIFHQGFEYFISCGKSAILSHDMARDKSPDVSNAKKSTKLSVQYDENLRQLLAQRRYRTSAVDINGGEANGGSSISLIAAQGQYNAQYAIPAQGKQAEAADAQPGLWPGVYDNSTRLLWMMNKTANSDKMDRDTFVIPTESRWGSDNTDYTKRVLTEYVNIINQGQITNYPYQIPPLIKIAKTHTQNFQLDMDTDNLISWYGLTDIFTGHFQEEMIQRYNGKTYEQKLDAYCNDLLGKVGVPSTTYKSWDLARKRQEVEKYVGRGLYSSIESDARNNYYIYNVGNITYTGLGHSTDMTQEEIQLFVNTMVSSYRATAAIPRIDITNEDAVTNGDETVLYVDIDEQNGLNDGMLDVRFKVVDPSVVQVSGRTFNLEYVGKNTTPTYVVGAGKTPLTRYEKQKSRDGKPVSVQVTDVNMEQEYFFRIPIKDILENGKVEYTLELDSLYYNSSNEQIDSSKRTKVIIMQKPLFQLN